MSLLLRNELRIVLCPERIALLHTERKRTLLGYRRDVHSNEIIPCDIAADGEMRWNSAVNKIEVALLPFAGRKMETKVILSNQFMQYALITWLDEVSDEEEMAFAKHCFRDIYGSVADSWSVRVSPSSAGVSALACAVDQRLLDELYGVLGRMELVAKSIQPHFMVAYNSCHDSLAGRSAWIALLEPGSLCLAMLQKGKLAWIRRSRIGDVWDAELATILERETYLADAEGEIDEVLLWAPHLDAADIPEMGRWKISQLKPSRKSGHRQQYGVLRDLMAGA